MMEGGYADGGALIKKQTRRQVSTSKPAAEVGYYRIRPPIKPITLGELAVE